MARSITTAKDLEEIGGELSGILASKDESIEELADLVRERYVRPACERYSLEFYSINGDYYFSDPKVNFHTHKRGKISTSEHAQAARLSALVPIFSMLDLDVDTSSRANLGHYVRDVT